MDENRSSIEKTPEKTTGKAPAKKDSAWDTILGIAVIAMLCFWIYSCLSSNGSKPDNTPKPPDWHRAESMKEVARRIKDRLAGELAAIGLDASNIVANAKAHPTRLRAVVPEHTRSRWLALSTNDEAVITRKFVEEREKQGLFDDTPGKIARIRAIAQRLVAVIPEIDSVPEIHILKADSVNACCLPDGTIFVNDGTLNEISDDSLLAAILAHELGHAAARHGNERVTYFLIGAAGGVAFEEMLARIAPVLDSGTGVSLIRLAYGIGTNAAFHLPQDRRQELEADRLGVRYLARAGFDPEAAVRLFAFLEKIAPQEHGAFMAMLSTHPVNAKRIEHARNVLAEPDLREMPKTSPSGKLKRKADEIDFTKAPAAVSNLMSRLPKKPKLPSGRRTAGRDSNNE